MTTLDRRTLLKMGGLAIPMAAVVPSFFSRAVLAGEPTDRVLVLVQLQGGNDGLNTVIPYGDDAYHKSRPGIGIAAGQVLQLDDYEGLHPGLAGLKGAWDDGTLAVMQGVGYPNPNRSHFTSTAGAHFRPSLTRGPAWCRRISKRRPRSLSPVDSS